MEGLGIEIPPPVLVPEIIMDDVVSVSAGVWSGTGHVMVLRNDNSLWSFGMNERGQFGNGTTAHSDYPVWIMDDVMAISAGGFHTMAIKTDGSLWTWGNNWSGQIGDGSTDNHNRPWQVNFPVS